jgi:hypothetical protein
MQAYRKSVTGAAANLVEMPEYQKLFPNPTDGEDVAMSKLE